MASRTRPVDQFIGLLFESMDKDIELTDELKNVLSKHIQKVYPDHISGLGPNESGSSSKKKKESDWDKFSKQWREDYKREHNVTKVPQEWMKLASEAYNKRNNEAK